MNETKKQALSENSERLKESAVDRLVMRFSLLSVLFYRNFTKGQKYIHRDHIKTKSSFKRDCKPLIVEVLEVRGKWLRYRHTMPGSVFQNESKRRDYFNFTYVLYDG